jgi:hypothetical protein
MQPSVRARSIAGGLAPPLFLIVLVVLTVAERDFLRRVGWSAVHRTPVEWPSLLALGHYGWVMITTFVICGIGGVALATAMWRVAVAGGERVVAALVALMSVAIALEAFRPDSPQSTGASSWHDAIHNGVFPAIPIASLAAAAAAIHTGRRAAPPLIGVAGGVALLGAMIVGVALTSVDVIAQLARYVYFGALLTWIELVALGTLARSQEASLGSAPPTRWRS